MARKSDGRFEPAVGKLGALRAAVSPGDDPVDESSVVDVEYRDRLRSVVFRDCDLRQADFQRTEFRNVRFERCDLTGARFAETRPHVNLRFEDCDLTGLYGVGALRGATIQGGDLESLAACLARELGITVEWNR